MWRVSKSNPFNRSYVRLSKELAERVDDAIETLLSAEKPERFGIPKGGLHVFAYELGQKCRILYRPDYTNNILKLFRVCSHKKVYGAD